MTKRRPFRPKASRPIGPFVRHEIPRDKNPDGTVEQMWTDLDHVVLVQSFLVASQRWVHLSIRRKDGEPLRSHWRTLQRIKDLILGEEHEAIELYPARARLEDKGNDYHLWCPLGVRFEIGLKPEAKP